MNEQLLVFLIVELEQAAALKYLYGWLHNHSKYRTLATPELANSLHYADVSVIFGISLSWSYLYFPFYSVGTII